MPVSPIRALNQGSDGIGRNEAWILTRENNRSSIERELSVNPNPRLHFEYVDLPRCVRFWKRGQRGVRTYYYLWQFAALIRAFKLHRVIRFNCGHHVSFVNDWLWTLFALLPIPYVWGPIGGNPRLPPQLLRRRRSRLIDGLRVVFQNIMRWIDPLCWISAIRAKAVLVITERTANTLPLKWLIANKVSVEPAIGIDNPLDFEPLFRDDLFSVLFVGRFIPIKAPHLAVEAFARISPTIRNAHLTLIGQGPEELDIRRRIKKHDIADRVSILPWLPREKVFAAMQEADVFLFPSMEGAGMVVLEAMAAGKPAVCLDFGGPGSMVSDLSGIRVRVSDYEEVVASLACALERFANDPGLRAMAGREAVKLVRDRYCWEKKTDLIESIYGSLD
jgi:glycosyltransferase involved in cell wall biosynthesis